MGRTTQVLWLVGLVYTAVAHQACDDGTGQCGLDNTDTAAGASDSSRLLPTATVLGTGLIVLLVTTLFLLRQLREESTLEKPIAPKYEPKKPIQVSKLEDYIDREKRKPKPFKAEYEGIASGQLYPSRIGALPANREKNRYISLLPYDHTRVVLEPEENNNTSDYINASFLSGYKDIAKAYVACQGPIESTVADMWRLIWQLNADRVVMLTQTKCETYWPEKVGEAAKYGNICVTFTSMERYADYVIRTLSVKCKTSTRTIRHFHFTSWPDMKPPKEAHPLLAFRRKLRSYQTTAKAPLVVHCSAGVGRTGTFVAMDYLIQQAESEEMVDVQAVVNSMRKQRINLIETPEQYHFVYEAVLEALTHTDTSIHAARFHHLYEQLLVHDQLQAGRATLSNLEEQFKYLHDFSSNWAYLNSYRISQVYLTTSMPLPHTIEKFWAMVYDNDCNTIIMLNEHDEEHTKTYWPWDPSEVLYFGSFMIQLDPQASPSEKMNEIVTVRDMLVSRHGRAPQRVRQFVAHNLWPSRHNAPVPHEGLKVLLCGLIRDVHQWQQIIGPSKVVVHCRDGVMRTGLYCAVTHIIAKLNYEKQVDIFSAVKHIQASNPHFIATMEQYKFLHDMAHYYISRLHTDENLNVLITPEDTGIEQNNIPNPRQLNEI